MLLYTYYAQNYAGIIGGSLSTAPPSAEEIQHQELDLTDTQVQHTTKTIDLFLLHRQAQFYYDNSLAINT